MGGRGRNSKYTSFAPSEEYRNSLFEIGVFCHLPGQCVRRAGAPCTGNTCYVIYGRKEEQQRFLCPARLASAEVRLPAYQRKRKGVTTSAGNRSKGPSAETELNFLQQQQQQQQQQESPLMPVPMLNGEATAAGTLPPPPERPASGADLHEAALPDSW